MGAFLWTVTGLVFAVVLSIVESAPVLLLRSRVKDRAGKVGTGLMDGALCAVMLHNIPEGMALAMVLMAALG